VATTASAEGASVEPPLSFSVGELSFGLYEPIYRTPLATSSVKAKRKVSKSPQIAQGLTGVRLLARPDEWALHMGLKVDGHPFSLAGREYISQVIRDTSDEIVIPKAAQMSFTVTFLTRTLHWVKERGWHHLYLLPLKAGAIPFVQARIDPIIDSNPILADCFNSVDNRLHKQSKDNINIYIRGTNIDRELQEIPVDVEVWDERDRMVEDNLEEARHRMDGSKVKKLTILSTPTVPGHGVDADDGWWNSDQHLWEIPCPGCGRFQVLTFEDSLKKGDSPDECVLECIHCHRSFSDGERADLNSKGRWVPHNLNGNTRGYHISQFNSPSMGLERIMEGWYTGQKDARKLRSFYNQSLGRPYVALGDQLTPELLDACREPGHGMGGIPESSVYIGVDIGTDIHMLAYTLNRYGHRRLWKMQIFREWHELDRFLSSLASFMCVIDAHPEKRAARDISKKYPGKVWLGFELDRPQTEEIAAFHPIKRGEAGRCMIDRTMGFDTVIQDYMEGKVILPSNARELGEHMPRKQFNGFYFQMCQMVRVEEEDNQSRMRAHWKKNKNADHWHHADMFARIATFKKPALEIPFGLSNAFDRSGSVAA
jgi:Phage terminase large subunit gpA, ATPase domain/Terminase large subunit gpA, endonuclease domain